MRRRYVMRNGELVEVSLDYVSEPRSEFHIMPDIRPYRSMADGSIVSSRSKHREMLKRNGMVEVGNDSSLYRKPKPIESPPGLKEALIRAAHKHLR